MPGTCVIGLQWGDEAKGKIVDLLTPKHDFVVRYQGGSNAGHTVMVGEEVYKLSLLPSGILTPGVTSVIAGGVVLNPAKVIEELDELAARVHRLLGFGWQRDGQPIGEQDVRMAIARQSPIMKGLDLIDNADWRVWATGPSALTLLPGANMLAEIWTANE